MESNTFTILSFKFIIPATFNRIPRFNTGIKRIITTSKKNGKNYNKIQFTHPWEPVLQIPDCLVKTYEKSVRSTILSWQRITFTRTRSQLLSLTLFCKKKKVANRMTIDFVETDYLNHHAVSFVNIYVCI